MEMTGGMIWKFVREFWEILGEMSPYLLFGFLMAGLLSAVISPETVERQIGRRGLLSVFKASLFGVPLPLCSCGVIPVGASLRKHGASRDATVAFLISTPQTGVDSIMVTLCMLGPLFAIIRPIAALVTGVIGGIMTFYFGANDETPDGNRSGGAGECSTACCSQAGNARNDGGGKLVRSLRYGFVTLPADIGRFLLVGLLIAASISALVPEDFFKSNLGTGILPMLIMMGVGIPMYVCSSASVLVAAALIHAGVSPGAALVFLMTGPATNAATITTIQNVLGRRTAAIYLLTIAFGALGAGVLLDAFAGSGHGNMMMSTHWMIPQPVNTVSAIIMILLLSQAFLRKKIG